MNCTVPEPDESGEKCIHCEQPIVDWGRQRDVGSSGKGLPWK
jgi:hypothetical protein